MLSVCDIYIDLFVDIIRSSYLRNTMSLSNASHYTGSIDIYFEICPDCLLRYKLALDHDFM
jgi:hypothetical protein